MDDPLTWLKQAQILDHIYASQKEIVRKQLKNPVHFLFTGSKGIGFYPIRRLADGIEKRDMAAGKCVSQEMIRYSPHLEKCGFLEIRPKHPDYNIYHEAYLTTCKGFETSPSSTDKIFWIKATSAPIVAHVSLTKNQIIKAMEAFKKGDRPNAFKEPRGWYITHPKTREAFPLKGIYGLATGLACSQFKTGEARKKLEKLKYDCIDKRKNLLDKQLQSDIERSLKDTSETRRQRLRSAPDKPAKIVQAVVRYQRNSDVVAERLFIANGKCDECEKHAPFISKNTGRPFLEVHHKIPLSDDGPDTLENTKALCPNCHREAHYG